jgi:hypothetical protein
MANTIILKRSATPGKVPTTAQLALGEIAINTYDGLIYIKKDNGTPSVVQIGGVTSVNGETGAVTITSDDVSDSGQTNKWASASVVRGHLSAGTGISYNSGTGVISTAQNLSTAGSPTFAGMTLTGGISSIAGSIIPSTDVTYDLGSPTKQWKDIYVGPGSLYVNGQKVLQDDSGTITFTADTDENIRIKTLGTGVLQLGSSTTTLQVDSTLQMTSGKRITDSAGVAVQFGDSINMNGDKIISLGAPSASTDAATKGYVDTTVAAISTSSISQGNSNVTVTDTGTGTVTVSVDGSTALTVDANGVTVAGNFTVSGTQTVVNSNTINLADNIITLNSDHTGAPSQNAGILIERGDEADTQLRWNEGSDIWQFTNDGATYYPMATSTDVLAEGSTNLYHTTARARGALSATTASGVSYNSTTGVISLGSIPNSSLSNNSITINGTSTALGGTRTLGTDDVAEGSTNLYFSNARARGAVSFTAGSGAYNSTTGVFTIPTNTNQLTNGASFITLSSLSAGTGISYNSSTGAISTSAIPNASLSNSSITVNSASTSLGGSVTLFAGTTTLQTSSANQALTGISSVTLPGSTSGSVQVIPAAAAGTGTVLTLPATTGTVVTTGDSGTVTNTMLAGSIANAKLANSSVTVGTTAIALGASSTTLAGLTSVTSTGFTGALTGNASTASAWANARTITLGGDLSGSVSIDGSANVTLTATVAANSVALGTDTTGNYMVDLTAGTGISITHTPGEGSTATITNSGVTSVNGSTGAITSVAKTTDTLYVGTTAVGLARASANQALTGISSVAMPGSTSGTLTLQPAAAAGTTTITLPATTGTVITSGDTGTVTNTMLAGSIANAKLANSSVTVGTTAISLGSSSTTLAGLASTTFSGSTSGTIQLIPAAVAGTGTVLTMPATTGTVVTTGDTGTVTNTMLAGSIANAKLANSAITINGTSTALGGSISVGTVTSVAAGSYLTGGTITGTGTLAVDATNLNTASKVVARDASGNFSAGTITATLSGTATGLAGTPNITVGTITSGAIAATGSITATGEITAYFSDERLKTDINPIEGALDKVMAIGGYTYKANDLAHELGVERYDNQIGLLAQEVEAVMPELVTESGLAGYKTIRYDKVVSVLVQAIKEQQAMIEELRQEVKSSRTLH